jgi:short-subunit dehydrogenase involved in D-alanine esterification of teichoic acids
MEQRVLIRAGASGIGKEIAGAFAAKGAKVCVCDIDAKALDTAAKDIPGLKTIVCDVSKREDIERSKRRLPGLLEINGMTRRRVA